MTNQRAAEAGPTRRLIDQFFEAWRGSTSDKVLEYFSDDAVVTLLGDGATLSGKRMVGEHWIIPMMKKYSDNTHHITSFMQAGNQIAVEWLFTAVHVSTGKEFRLQGCSVYWVTENLIERGHVYFTSLR
jgi:ketosteroid isomerase-like protein